MQREQPFRDPRSLSVRPYCLICTSLNLTRYTWGSNRSDFNWNRGKFLVTCTSLGRTPWLRRFPTPQTEGWSFLIRRFGGVFRLSAIESWRAATRPRDKRNGPSVLRRRWCRAAPPGNPIYLERTMRQWQEESDRSVGTGEIWGRCRSSIILGCTRYFTWSHYFGGR